MATHHQHCIVCGNAYDGWGNCPFCAAKRRAEENLQQSARQHNEALEAAERAAAQQSADSQQLREEIKKQTEAIQEAALEAELIAEEAAEEHRRTTANAWRLQSEAKSKRAGSLYASGMFQEALQLAVESINQDPGNLDAFWVAASSSLSLGQIAGAKSYLGKAVQLLNLPEYRRSPQHFVEVLNILSRQSELFSLVSVFSSTLTRNVRFWNQSKNTVSDAETLMGMLIKLGELTEASLVFDWLVQSAPSSQILLGAALRLVKVFLQQGDHAKACDVSGKLPAVCESLLNQCYMFEIQSLLGNDAQKQFKEFLERFDIQSRGALERDIPQVKELAGKEVSQETVGEIMRMISEKYTDWKSAIESQIFKGAVRAAKSAKHKTHGGWVGGIGFVGLIILGRWLMVTHGPFPEKTGGFLTFGAILGAIIIGVVYETFEKDVKIRRETISEAASAFARQNSAFTKLSLPVVTPRSANKLIFLLLPIYTVTCVLYITTWLAIMYSQRINQGTPAHRTVATAAPPTTHLRTPHASQAVPRPATPAVAAAPASMSELFPMPHARMAGPLLFFECGDVVPPKNQRAYAARFPRNSTQYIHWELDLTYPPVGYSLRLPIRAVWTDPGGNVVWQQIRPYRVAARWTHSWYSNRWGCENPSCFAYGKYRVDLYTRGNKIASGTFEIY